MNAELELHFLPFPGWLLLFLIHHPEVQKKVQAELDQVCGDSLPLLAHRQRYEDCIIKKKNKSVFFLNFLLYIESLVYTEAVLMEAQRLSTVVPFAVPHRAMKDTKLKGFFIPEVLYRLYIKQLFSSNCRHYSFMFYNKGSIAMINLYSVHMDAAYWKDPKVFRPERHFNGEGQLVKTDHLLPFGTGNSMIFLFIIFHC